MQRKAIGEMRIETQKLVKRLKELEEGEELPYGEIDSLIGGGVRTTQRHILTSAVRHVMRNDDIIISTVIGQGVKRLAPPEAVGVITSGRERVRRASRRLFSKSAHIDYERLDIGSKARLNAERTVLYFIGETARGKAVTSIEARAANNVLTIAETLEHFGERKGDKQLKLA